MGDQTTAVLLIEDNPGDATLLEVMLADAGGASFTLVRADRLSTGLAHLATGGIDVVLLDLSLPDSQGLDTFFRAQAQAPTLPIVVLSGTSDEIVAVRAVHEGAQDYLVKGQVNGLLLARALHYAIERKHAEEMLKQTAAELTHSNRQLQQLAADLEQLAASERRARQELQKAESQLVQAEKLAGLGQLAAGVAHEINNPLAFVGTNLAVLQRDVAALRDLLRLYQEMERTPASSWPDILTRSRAFAEEIDLPYTLGNLESLLTRSRDGLKRIQQIVKDLGDFARTNALGDLDEGVDLNPGIESTIVLIRGRAEKRQIELAMDLAPLPPATCSPGRVNQVVLNLLVNAIDACSEGGHVTVRTRAGPDGVEIHVLDTGCGIDPAIRDKIFDPFFTTKPPGQGTGLGLSISRALVEEHGGRIEVESAPRQGAHFTVHLPLRPRRASSAPLEAVSCMTR